MDHNETEQNGIYENDGENNIRNIGMEDTEDMEESDMYVKFNKPYVFEEDDVYKGIDLSGLEKLTAKDLGDIEKRYYRSGITSFNPENTVTYAKFAAQKATGLPIEFFDQLPAKDMIDVKKAVVNFLFV